MKTTKSAPSKNMLIIISVIPIFSAISFLMVALLKYDDVDIHIPLILATIIASLLAVFVLDIKWKELETGIFDSIQSAMQAILICCIIGFIIASWIIGGIVPAIIYYGLQLLSPHFFLVTCLLISGVVGIATGSSWITCGTIGVALIGIGIGMKIPSEVTAGAIISGAFLGDKMSPFSDTTNLAPVAAGTTLFVHIRNMLWTTLSSCIIAGILFYLVNRNYTAAGMDEGIIASIMEALHGEFYITPVLLLPPALIILMMIFKIPIIPGLFLSVALGVVCALVFQGADMNSIGAALQNGYKASTKNQEVNYLLSRGGMQNMMWTVSLILCSLSFGGVMEKSGMLSVIADGIMRFAKNTALLIICTMVTAISVTLTTGEQYLSILITGKMYKNEYSKRKLAPENLSRALEDAGTLTSPLIPWSTCAVAVSGYLGVATVDYLPYCFMNLLNPIVASIFAITGFKVILLQSQQNDIRR